MKIDTVKLPGRYIHEATGSHNGLPVGIKAISNSNREIKRIYLTTDKSQSKFLTKPNGFPLSTFIVFQSEGKSFACNGTLNGQAVKSSLLGYSGGTQPPLDLIQMMTDAHFRMYNNVILPFIKQLSINRTSESN